MTNDVRTETTETFETHSVSSRDGTSISYRRLGQGPGLVVLHGTMSSAHNHMQLAETLAGSFTVIVPDRRGRGLSGPYGTEYILGTEVDDLAAVLSVTGARNVFGVSSGGIIALHAAFTLPALERVAVYEPPLFADRSVPSAVLIRFDEEIAEGRVSAALITAMNGAEMGPAIFRAMPRWLTERLTSVAMKQEDKKADSGYVPMRELAPTLHYDFQLVVEASGDQGLFGAFRPRLLLLGGSKSPEYLKTALDTLEKVVPGAERVEFPGLGHEASWNSDRGGEPGPVAQELGRFFS